MPAIKEERNTGRQGAKSTRVLYGVLLPIALLMAGVALARDEPLLHEFFTSSGGSVPAPATPDAPRGALPPAADSITSSTSVGVTSLSPEGAESYRLDGDTTRPDRVAYDDPFSPSIPPFKRLFAFDAITEDFALIVANPQLEPVRLKARSGPNDDQFFADMAVHIGSLRQVRIPSVGPQTRIVNASLTPDVPFEVGRDSAGNWFLRGPNTGDYRLVMHLAVERAVFGSEFLDVTWAALSPALPSVPGSIAAAAEPVLARLGLSRKVRPAQAVRLLVRYFRDFEPSTSAVAGLAGAQLYQSVALGQLGVCRHRSFAFVATALALGLPTRFVQNEAHAWVEVFDSLRWHRVDLGGAAGEMQMTTRVDVRHATPEDPYRWPGQGRSGSEMASSALRALRRAAETGAASSTTDNSQPDGNTSPSPGPQASEPSSAQPDEVPVLDVSNLTVSVAVNQLARGGSLAISGRALRADVPCVLTPVSIFLMSKEQAKQIGTLVTDAEGRYEGSITLPANIVVGDYELEVRTQAQSVCGAGIAR